MWKPKYPITFMGLNPGGEKFIKPALSNENGSSYLCESWVYRKKRYSEGKSPLQKQVVQLYETLASTLSSYVSAEDLLNGSMASNFVPFRSEKWGNLKNKNDALVFSRDLWGNRIIEVPSSLYITMSKVVFKEVDLLLKGAGYNASVTSSSKKVGWGKVTYQVKEYTKGNHSVALIRLPHLSTYKIFSRRECLPAIEHIASISEQYLSPSI